MQLPALHNKGYKALQELEQLMQLNSPTAHLNRSKFFGLSNKKVKQFMIYEILKLYNVSYVHNWKWQVK